VQLERHEEHAKEIMEACIALESCMSSQLIAGGLVTGLQPLNNSFQCFGDVIFFTIVMTETFEFVGLVFTSV
jgi:hypothetical protein